jgi:hypothetical protein
VAKVAKVANKISSPDKVARVVAASRAAVRSPDSNSNSLVRVGSKAAVKADSKTSNFLLCRCTEPRLLAGVFLFSLSTQAGSANASRGSAQTESREEDMTHIALLGDSVIDNKAYVGQGRDVAEQLRTLAPQWQVTRLAVDGAVSSGVRRQLDKLPPCAT